MESKTIEDAERALLAHANDFLQSGLWSWSGYFPNDFYGKEGEKYYRWSKMAYDLIMALESARARAK
jgi:hypothetical protein